MSLFQPPDASEAEIFSLAKQCKRLPSEIDDEDYVRLKNYVAYTTAIEVGASKKNSS